MSQVHPEPAVLGRKTGFHRSTILALAILTLLGLFLLVSSTNYLSNSISQYDAKRLVQMALMHLVILMALLDRGIRLKFATQLDRISPSTSVGLLLFFGLGITSSLVNADSLFSLSYSLLDVYMLLLMVAIMLVVASCRSIAGEKFDRLAIALIVLLGLAVGTQELVGVYVAWSAGQQFSYDIALTHFSHPRFFNQLQSWTLPVIVVLPVLFPRHRLATVFTLLVLCLHWYILLMTGARGSTISLLVALALSVLFIPVARTTIIKWQMSGLLLGVLLYGSMLLGPDTGWEPLAASTVLPNVTESIDTRDAGAESPEARSPNDYSGTNPFFSLSLGRPMKHSSGRTDLWKAAAGYARQSPILGIGPMNYACKGPIGRVGSPHNFALQIMSEWGVPAMLVLLAIVLLVVRNLWSALRSPCTDNCLPVRKMQIMLATGILAAGLHAGLSGILITPASQVTGALICGWLLGTFRVQEHRSETRKWNVMAIGTLCLILSVGAVYWPFAIDEVKNMAVYKEQLPDIEKVMPRYWQLGKACLSYK